MDKSKSFSLFGIEFAPVWIPLERRLQVSFAILLCCVDKRGISHPIIFIINNGKYLYILDICSTLLDLNIYHTKYSWYGMVLLDLILFEYIQMDCNSIPRLGSLRLEDTGTRGKKNKLHVRDQTNYLLHQFINNEQKFDSI